MGPSDRVLVVGDGKLGQLIAQTMQSTGCDLLVLGHYRNKLDCLARRGIRTGRAEEIGEGSFDLVVECTGRPEGFALARRGLRPQATLVMKSTYAADLTFDISSLGVDEITLVGSRCGPFPSALRLLAEGRVEVHSLIHGRYPLAEGLVAFDHAQRSGVLKVLLDIGRP